MVPDGCSTPNITYTFQPPGRGKGGVRGKGGGRGKGVIFSLKNDLEVAHIKSTYIPLART